MGKKHSLNLKIIAMTSMAVFSLAAVFVSTAAWFTVMRQVKTGGDGFMASKITPVVTKVEIFEKAVTSVQKDSEQNSYIYKNTPSLSYIYGSDQGKEVENSVPIGRYSIFEDTKSLLFLFTLDKTKTEELKTSQLTVKTSTENDKSLYAVNSTTHKVKRPLNTEGNDLSSIVSFSSFAFTDTDHSVMTKGDQTYVVNKDSINDTYKNQTFVNSSTYSYSPSILLTDTDLSSVSQIGVILEYNTNLIEHLYSINLGSEVMNELSDIEFNNIDFSFHI